MVSQVEKTLFLHSIQLTHRVITNNIFRHFAIKCHPCTMHPKDKHSPIAVKDDKIGTVEGGVLQIRSLCDTILANINISQAVDSPFRVEALRWTETGKLGALVDSKGSKCVLIIHPTDLSIYVVKQPRLQMIADFQWFGESVVIYSENKLNANFYICDPTSSYYRIYNQLIYPKITASRPKSCIESFIIRKDNRDLLLNLVKTDKEAVLMNSLRLKTLDCQALEWSPCGTHFLVIDSSVKGTIHIGNLFVGEVCMTRPTACPTVASWWLKNKVRVVVGDVRGDVVVYSLLRNLEVEVTLRFIDNLKPGSIFQQEGGLFRKSNSLPGPLGKSRSVTCISFTSQFIVLSLECFPSVLFIWDLHKPLAAIVSSFPIVGCEIKPEREFILLNNGSQIVFWVYGENPKVVFGCAKGIKSFCVVDEDPKNVKMVVESSDGYAIVTFPHGETDTTALSHLRRGSSPMYANESTSVRRIIDEVQQKEWGDPKLNNVSLTRVINDGDTFRHKKVCR